MLSLQAFSRRFFITGMIVVSTCLPAHAEKLELKESYTNAQVYVCKAEISSQGEESFTKSKDQEQREPLVAKATFQFSERRLAPAGRDALAFRAIRKFDLASVTTTVGDLTTGATLSPNAKTIISAGYREGVRHYSPAVKLDRDSLDLLEIPGDPLVLAALLPLEPVDVDDEWKPSDWVMQMLTGIEAVESSALTCKLTAANSISAKITFSGKVKGQRYGASTEVDVNGTLIFDMRTSHVAQTQAIYKIKSDIGTIIPGLDIVVTSNLVRTVSDETELFSDAEIESVPLDPAVDLLQLTFEAPEWGVKIEHKRNWHLFHAVLEGANPVTIFRLVEHGTLVCQCNFSPLLNLAPGATVPSEQFEADIQESLGKSFKKFGERDLISTEDGRQILRIFVEGEQEVRGAKGSALIPMTWIYYLVINPTGRQLSFVFAVESPLVEQLNNRDLEFVKSQRFTAKKR